MECKVIQDLLPLYVDGCCSEESAKLVQEHIAGCDTCKCIYENMKTTCEIEEVLQTPKTMRRINEWKAALLQSILLYVTFGLIAVGAALEAETKSLLNGLWAVSLLNPATGFMLSLANWYFVRLYKSRRCFSNCSALITIFMTVVAYIWSVFHYEFQLIKLIAYADGRYHILICIVLNVAFCILSKVLSSVYAKMLGKE